MKIFNYKFRTLFVILITFKSFYTFGQHTSFEDLFFKGKIEWNGKQETSVPLYTKNGIPLIKVTINGKEYTFLFDTGAMVGLLSPKAAENLKIIDSFSVSDGSSENLKPICQTDFVIGDITFKESTFAISDISLIQNIGCTPIDGIIGANQIRLCNWKIDNDQQKIFFSSSAFKAEKDGKELSFWLYNLSLPIIKLQLPNKLQVGFLFDTGFQGTLSLTDSTFFQNIHPPKNKVVEGIGKTDITLLRLNEGKKYATQIDTLYNGKDVFTNTFATVSNRKPLVGFHFLENYNTIINWKKKKIILENRHTTNTNLQKDDESYGFSTYFNEKGQVCVALLWKGTNADSIGIKVGDIITSFNGKDISNITNEDWCSIKKEMEKSISPISIVIPNRNNGQPMKFDKRNLVK